ncbi:hypothetical protein M2146_001137 [Lachnospiraceae bacterium PF1-22]
MATIFKRKRDYKLKKKGSVGYVYSFNYFGDAQFKDKTVGCVDVGILFHVYGKDGKEALLDEALPENLVTVSYDVNEGFKIVRNEEIIKNYLRDYDFEKIDYEIKDYYIGVLVDADDEFLEELNKLSEKVSKELIETMKHVSHTEALAAFKEDVMNIFALDPTGFDISDNKRAQVPSYWID